MMYSKHFLFFSNSLNGCYCGLIGMPYVHAEHTSEESMVHTKPMNGKSTSNKMGMGALSKSQKFISPHKFHGT